MTYKPPTKTYLGDAVYASCDGYYVTLTTDDGYTSVNTIHLEPQVVEAFDRYMRRVRGEEG